MHLCFWLSGQRKIPFSMQSVVCAHVNKFLPLALPWICIAFWGRKKKFFCLCIGHNKCAEQHEKGFCFTFKREKYLLQSHYQNAFPEWGTSGLEVCEWIWIQTTSGDKCLRDVKINGQALKITSFYSLKYYPRLFLNWYLARDDNKKASDGGENGEK